jgi:hypothetical protein
LAKLRYRPIQKLLLAIFSLLQIYKKTKVVYSSVGGENNISVKTLIEEGILTTADIDNVNGKTSQTITDAPKEMALSIN